MPLAFAQADRAFPIIAIDLQMSREEALAESRRLEKLHRFGPKGYEQAASFYGGDEVETYLEKEGGGSEAFQRLLESGTYYPYTWSVRHFVPEEWAETEFEFTPEGRLWGYWVTLDDEEDGASLERAEARRLAEEQAKTFGVDLSDFRPKSSESYGGPDEGIRRDWTFEYVRRDPAIEDAAFNTRLYVNGDRFGGFEQRIELPRSYERAQAEVDGTRMVILGIVGFVAGTVFVLGGGFALVVLARRRQYEWKRAVGWGGVLALLTALAELNYLPVRWYDYSTFGSKSMFVGEQVSWAAQIFLGTWAMAAAALLVAEGLTRTAFPSQIQLWKVWRRPNASSTAVLGRTAGGYLWAFVMVGYVTAFYAVMTLIFDWYTPASPSADPDMLATYVPFLGPLSMALEAGVMEEALFRALPLAGAVLLGRRYGHRRLFLGVGLVAQALVFAGAHVSYPTEPVYARIVELFLPALAFGAVYLLFGLVPAILAHFTYDYVLMGLPIFTTQTSSIGEKAAFVAVGLLPLAVVLIARLRARRWTSVDPADLNSGWQPPEPPPQIAPRAPSTPGRRTAAALVALALVGAAGWVATTDFSTGMPAIEIGAEEAEANARAYLEDQGVDVDRLEVTTTVLAEPGPVDEYLMEEHGPEVYRRLSGDYVYEPGWSVYFESERSEDWYDVTLDSQGAVVDPITFPDEVVKASKLPEQEAVALAVDAVKEQLDVTVSAADLDEAEYWGEEQVDWYVTFDLSEPPLEPGVAKVTVEVWAGQATGVYRFLDVPEEYYQDFWGPSDTTRLVSDVVEPVLLALAGAACLFALVAAFRRRSSLRVFLVTAGVLFVADLGNQLNGWRMSFSEAAPEYDGASVAGAVTGTAFGAAMLAAVVGLLAAAAWGLRPQPQPGLRRTWLAGIPVGVALAGLAYPALGAVESPAVQWPDYTPLDSIVPQLAGLSTVSASVVLAALTAITAGLVNLLTRGWTRNRGPAVLALAALGAMAMAAEDGVAGLQALGLSAALAAVLAVGSYLLVFRHNLAAVFPAAATATGLIGVARGIAPAFPGSGWVAAAGAVAALVVAGLLTPAFSRPMPANFGKRKSRTDFNSYWRRVAWTKPFAAAIPVLDDRLLAQVRAITKTGRKAQVTPCRVLLKDGTVKERVLLAEASRFLGPWGFPEEGDPRFLDAAGIARIEPSPHRLPAWMGRKVQRRAKPVDGRRYFRLKLRDGRVLDCWTSTVADFPALPDGVRPDDVVTVKPERRPKDLDGRLPQARCDWCLYRDPGKLYPGTEPVKGFVILPTRPLAPPAG